MRNNYNNTTIFGLVPNYNTNRGMVLDGRTPPGSKSDQWKTDTQFGLHDGGIHHSIMKFLEQQPNRRTTFQNIQQQFTNLDTDEVKMYLRELSKQEIVSML